MPNDTRLLHIQDEHNYFTKIKLVFGTIMAPSEMLKLSKKLEHAFFTSAQIHPTKIRRTLCCFVLPC